MVGEDVADNAVVGTVFATDRDGLNQIVYMSEPSDFSVNSSSGELAKTPGVQLDFEDV